MNNNNWWCPHCRREVSEEEVTYQLMHEVCGYDVMEEKPQSEIDMEAQLLERTLERDRALAENARLRKALEWYANGWNHLEPHNKVAGDGGERARKALEVK